MRLDLGREITAAQVTHRPRMQARYRQERQRLAVATQRDPAAGHRHYLTHLAQRLGERAPVAGGEVADESRHVPRTPDAHRTTVGAVDESDETVARKYEAHQRQHAEAPQRRLRLLIPEYRQSHRRCQQRQRYRPHHRGCTVGAQRQVPEPAGGSEAEGEAIERFMVVMAHAGSEQAGHTPHKARLIAVAHRIAPPPEPRQVGHQQRREQDRQQQRQPADDETFGRWSHSAIGILGESHQREQ